MLIILTTKYRKSKIFLAFIYKKSYHPTMKTSTYMSNARNALKLKQKDMAILLGVRQVNLCKWEKGWTVPPGDIILRVMALLKSRKRR